MPMEIVRDNIVKMDVDAIVNSTNSLLQMDSGVCKAIFESAGVEELTDACRVYKKCPMSSAVITAGFNLPAKYIIHTVGPIWQGGEREEREALSLCYKNCLRLAQENNCNSIAFPLISSGSYKIPIDIALESAISAILDYLRNHDDITVFLVVYSQNALDAARKLFLNIEDRLNGEYIKLRRDAQYKFYFQYDLEMQKGLCLHQTIKKGGSFYEYVNRRAEPFNSRLLWLIAKSEREVPDVYKAAHIDKRTFSKIKNDRKYMPSKNTIIAFIMALEMDRENAIDLLGRAGYALSPSILFDRIIEYHIIEKKYNIDELNEVLEKNNLATIRVKQKKRKTIRV